MRPDLTVSVRRPWHWGIAIVGDPSADSAVPEVVDGQIVSANASSMVISVRHAQDVEDLDNGFAEAQITVRVFSDAAVGYSPNSAVVFFGRLSLPRGRLSVGDADEEVAIDVSTGHHRVAVSVVPDGDAHPELVQIDLLSDA